MWTLVAVREASVTINGIQLLRSVSLEVAAGSRVSIVGPNGAGKTTLLRLILGRLTPTAGTVERARAVRHHSAIASLTGPPPLFRDLTVGDHIAMLRAAWGDAMVPDVERAVVDALDVAHLVERFPAELSSGERQLVGLTLTLVRPARLLVLDEPEQRLDTNRRHALDALLREPLLHERAVVIATHDAVLGRIQGAAIVDLTP